MKVKIPHPPKEAAVNKNKNKVATTDPSDDDETLASVAESKSKRKSPRLKDPPIEKHPTPPTDETRDILLSMLDPYYKQTIFHYYEKRKREGSKNTVSESDEIFTKFKSYLRKSRGEFYKIGHRGGERYMVDSKEDIIKSK